MIKKRNPFDFVKSVSYDKKDIMVDDIEEKAYQPFLINKALSYHQDSVFFANEMNVRGSTDNRLQYQIEAGSHASLFLLMSREFHSLFP